MQLWQQHLLRRTRLQPLLLGQLSVVQLPRMHGERAPGSGDLHVWKQHHLLDRPCLPLRQLRLPDVHGERAPRSGDVQMRERLLLYRSFLPLRHV